MMAPAPWGVSQQIRPGGWGVSLNTWDTSHSTPVCSHSLVTAYTTQHVYLHVCITQPSDDIGCHMCVL